MINIPLEFMIYIISALVAAAISIIYYIFDLKRTDEENKVRKNSVEGSHDMILQQTTTYRRYK